MVRALTTWLSEKCAVRRTAGMVMPSAPVRNCAAGLSAYSSSVLVTPGTAVCGARGMTVIRSGSAGWVVGVWYGWRTPM